MDRKILTSILVKPAGPDCTMACNYCFYRGKESLFNEGPLHRMSHEVLEEMIRQLMRSPSQDLSIGWQGGEPTLMGLPFFKKAVELEQRYGRGKTVGNGLQTNGMLLDREWAEFFREFSFLVGLSIDGPAHVHDRYRRTHGGGLTWQRVRDTARLLLDAGVSVNALTVVNDYSVMFPREIYEHHKDLGLSFMQFIPCVESDPAHPGLPAPFSVPAAQYGAFLCEIFDLWRADFVGDSPTTSVRFFESLLFSCAGFSPPECTLCEECGVYLVVEHNGDVYACDFFVDPSWRLGNVMQDRLESLLNGERQTEFGRMKARLPEGCADCRWISLCRGGCIKDRVRAGDMKGNFLCEAFKIFFAHADGELRGLVERWRRRQDARNRAGGIGRNDPCPCGSGKKYKRCCGAGV